MKFGYIVAALACVSAGCQKGETKVLIGGSLPGVSDSVVVISGSRVKAAGARRDVPVPQDSERFDLTGKSLVAVGSAGVAPGETASLDVHEGSANGPVVRRMRSGEWLP